MKERKPTAAAESRTVSGVQDIVANSIPKLLATKTNDTGQRRIADMLPYEASHHDQVRRYE